MVRGAVPGSKGGWVMVRDAVKQPHKDSPMPASVKKRETQAAAPAAEAPLNKGGGLNVKTKVLNLDNKAAGEVDLKDDDLRSRAARRSHPARRRLAARQAPRRHAQDSDARRNQPHEEETRYKQKGTRQARHGARSAPLFVGGAQGHGPGHPQP